MKPRAQHESMKKTQEQTPGDRLRSLRQQRGLTLRDVHEFSLELARRFGQTAFVIPPSRLHEFEKKNIVPSIHRVCTLARVYNCSPQKILKLYGLPPQ
jgi:transcriptional regulator with XRE-family HTH domain